jgi:hypothetical protein
MKLTDIIKTVSTQSPSGRNHDLYSNLIRREARLGGTIFGPQPKNGRREFFCLDEHTWVWYEDWLDGKNIRRSRTTRYDVRDRAILKSYNGGPYQKVSQAEAKRLLEAARIYEQRVKNELYPEYTS